jgi:hypothetical protein
MPSLFWARRDRRWRQGPHGRAELRGGLPSWKVWRLLVNCSMLVLCKIVEFLPASDDVGVNEISRIVGTHR